MGRDLTGRERQTAYRRSLKERDNLAKRLGQVAGLLETEAVASNPKDWNVLHLKEQKRSWDVLRLKEQKHSWDVLHFHEQAHSWNVLHFKDQKRSKKKGKTTPVVLALSGAGADSRASKVPRSQG